jgi:hypothetical protein
MRIPTRYAVAAVESLDPVHGRNPKDDFLSLAFAEKKAGNHSREESQRIGRVQLSPAPAMSLPET